MAGTEPQIPLPIATAFSRTVGDVLDKQTQTLHLLPIGSTTISGAMTVLLESVNKLTKAMYSVPSPPIEVAPPPAAGPGKKGAASAAPPAIVAPPQSTFPPIPLCLSTAGAPQATRVPLDVLMKAITATLTQPPDVPCEVRLAVDYRSGVLIKQDKGPDGTPLPIGEKDIMYTFNGPQDPGVNGHDVVEAIVQQWKENEIVSIEDPLHCRDIPSLRLLKSRVTETIEKARADPSCRELGYNRSGVGGEEGCPLQVVADCACQSIDDLRVLAGEAVFNAIKIRLEMVPSLGMAIDICKAAREAGWAVIISVNEDSPETADTFIADFAVGIGASQFMGGGLLTCEYTSKYNRLMEIQKENESIKFIGKEFRR